MLWSDAKQALSGCQLNVGNVAHFPTTQPYCPFSPSLIFDANLDRDAALTQPLELDAEVG